MTFAAGDDLVQEFALIRTSGGLPDYTGGVHVQKESETTERDVVSLAPRCGWRRHRCRRVVRGSARGSRFTARKKFSTFTRDLLELAEWLKGCRIHAVAMESTSVYWIPLYQILETHGFEVFLVNAQYVKNVPGRKTDVSDCQWIQYLHSVGLLRGSFRPPDVICAIRSLWRHRDSVIQMAAQHVMHMQKSLDQMNLQLHHVLSEITGLSGQRILDAILAGERDPIKVAELCHGRVKSSQDTIAKALEGHYRSEHLFTLKHRWPAIATINSRSKKWTARFIDR